MIEVTEQINEVRREVSGRTLKAGEARVVTLSRSYPAQLAEVWGACTDADRIPRWFLPVSGELRVGGRYQFEGNAGGVITRCDPPVGLDATWEFGGDTSWIELRLSDEGHDRTRFQLNHIALVDDERWARFGPGAVGVGWDGALLGMYLHLTTGEAVDPSEMAEWSASPDGHRFLASAGDSWCEASAAYGTDRAAARAAADRTTAFYTGT